MRALLILVASALSISPDQSQPSATSIDVSTLKVGRPALVAELDLSALRGDLHRLSWSADNAYIHLQTVEGREAQQHDYIVALFDGAVSKAFGEPEWAGAYWARKSDLGAPGLPGLRLEVAQTNRRTRPAPFAGGFSNGGAQAPDVKNPVDAYESEVTVRLLGEEIGSWINGAPMAGETFGWGPAGSGALVFVDAAGRLLFLDQEKRKQIVAGVKGAWMPAWSSDGSRVAFLQKSGRRKFRLLSATLARTASDA